MIPKIAARGTSFKGAHQYYGHDKNADTSERVMFIETLNMRTNDPEKGWRVMAATAMNEEELKKEAGIHWNGEATQKPVYSFSLAWDKDQTPTHEEMKEAALSALAHRKMDELQAMLYGHNDTDNLHVHVLVNMIHPETGRTAEIWQDRLELSEWAEQYEREHGGIRCDKRVENNEKRREGEFVKHRENAIQNAWDQSKTGQEFADNLEAKGYMLAQGNKRMVIVDPYGKTMNPTRQIAGEDGKNIKAKMLNDRLADLDMERIKSADEAIKLQAKREYIDREQYNIEQDQKNIDAAIAADRERGTREDDTQRGGGGEKIKQPGSFAEELDPVLEKEREYAARRNKFAGGMQSYYTRLHIEAQINQAREEVSNSKTLWGRMNGSYGAAQGALEGLQKNLEVATQREAEALKIYDERQRIEREKFEQAASPAPEKPDRTATLSKDQGSVASELDKTRAEEATREKEAAQIEEIYGQQEKNIEEGRRLGRIPRYEQTEETYEPPAPAYEPPPIPVPDFEEEARRKQALQEQYDRAASNDNAPEPQPQPEQEQERGRDYGGYER